MGISCQIIKNNKGEILAVEAPNGYSSILYNDLKKSLPEQSALDLWSYSYTDSFLENEQATERDENGEFLIDTVLKRLKKDYTQSPLSTEDIFELSESFPHTNTQTLFSDLNQAFYVGGIFNPTKESLSNLYSPSEISYILSNSQVQEDIKKLISQLQGADNIKLHPITGVRNNQITKFGKSKGIDVDVSELVGIEDVYKFDDTAKQVLGEAYTKELSDTLYKNLIDKQKIEITDEKGNPIYTNSTYSTLENTIRTGVSNANINILIDAALSLDEDLFERIDKILKEIKKEFLYNYGIDLINFDTVLQTKPQENVRDFLEQINAFSALLAQDALEVEDVQDFSKLYNEFFNIEEEQKYKITEKSEDTLLAIETEKSELDLFKEQGLIKVDDGLYHKVDVDTIAEEDFISLAIEDSSILPQEAFYPSAFTADNSFKQDKVKNTPEVRRDIKRFLTIKASQFYGEDVEGRQLVIAKLAFNHPLQIRDIITNVDIEGLDVKYLTTSFHRDIYTEIVEQKDKNSSLYNTVLKYIGFDSRGIFLKTGENSILNRFKSLPDKGVFKHLKDYFKLNKRLSHVADVSQDILDVNKKRDLYVNNPILLKEYKGEKDIVDGNYTIKNMFDDFIRIGDNIFERVGGLTNVSIYELSGTNSTKNIHKKTEHKNTEVKYNELDLKNLTYKAAPSSKHVTIKKPKKEVLENIDKCS